MKIKLIIKEPYERPYIAEIESEQELEDRQSAAEEELRALKAEKGKDDLPTPPAQRWMPHSYEHYYFYDSTGAVDAKIWCFEPGDIDRYNLGNVFMQRSDAEFAVERSRVILAMQAWSGKCCDPYEIIYNYSADRVIPNMDSDIFLHGNIRFASFDAACNCIKAVGEDRLKKYYFGIPEKEEPKI